MARAFVGSVAVMLMSFGLVLAQNGAQQLDRNNPGQNQKGMQQEAKILSVDPQKHTVTVEMKGENGKNTKRTFQLTEDIRMFDSEGHAAAIDVFKSGNEVLVVEEQGKLKELHKKEGPNRNK